MTRRSSLDPLGNEFMVPIPDAIRPGSKRFEFEPGFPTIDLEDRTMSAPVDLSERTRVTQLRELGIAKWSPDKRVVPGIRQSILQPVERCRIDAKLRTNSFPLGHMRMLHDDTVDYTMAHGQIDQAAGMLISSRHTADKTVVQAAFTKKYGKLVGPLLGALGVLDYDFYEPTYDEYLSWETTKAVAARVQELLEEYQEHKEMINEGMPEPDIDRMQGISDDELAAAMMEIRGGTKTGAGGNDWAKMEVTEPPRPVNLSSELKSRKTIKSDTGAVPIALHRATIDGRVFREKRRKPGAGVVIIDQSGSMQMSSDDIERILAHLPGAVIAAYASSGTRGELRVLAKRGRRVAPRDLIVNGGGNGVDGPALLWSEQFPGPRFWVSDGYVTGEHDGLLKRSCFQDLKATVARARILRVGSCDELDLRLARKKMRA